jgi:NAD(P)-dependent dehydrogenase (short-subunit alcohol dehydrogenase family)
LLHWKKASEKIDICINNAATGALTPVFSEDDNGDFERVIQTNLMGSWYVTKAVAHHMKNHGIYGSIINIGSVNGDSFPYKELTAYAVSKAGVIHMTKSLVTELSQYKIRINTINPGPVQSDLLGSPNKHNPEFWKDKIPAGFIAEPSDLDGLILYLASNNASQYVTGATFTIDGGISWGR